MSEVPPQNFLVLPFGDGEYTFRLPVGQITELQVKCDAGIGLIFARMVSCRARDTRTGEVMFNPLEARFKYEDVAETIRLALIGGEVGTVNGQEVKVTPAKAMQLVKQYVHERPLQEGWTTAVAILTTFVVGYTDPDAPKQPEKKSPAEALPSESVKAT